MDRGFNLILNPYRQPFIAPRYLRLVVVLFFRVQIYKVSFIEEIQGPDLVPDF